MTLWTPHFIDTHSYSARDLRSVVADFPLQEGVVGNPLDSTPLKVSDTDPDSRNVQVAPGAAWVDADWSSETFPKGRYHVVSDSIETLAVPSNGTALPRIDAVILTVDDALAGASEGSSTNAAYIDVWTGTPTTGATLDNLLGAPTAGATQLLLAHINAPIGAGNITSSASMIRDRRPHCRGDRFRFASATSYALSSANMQGNTGGYLEVASGLVRVSVTGWVVTAAAAYEFSVWPVVDGSQPGVSSGGSARFWGQQEATARSVAISCEWLLSVTPGSHHFSIDASSPSTTTIQAVASGSSFEVVYEEVILPSIRNNA